MRFFVSRGTGLLWSTDTCTAQRLMLNALDIAQSVKQIPVTRYFSPLLCLLVWNFGLWNPGVNGIIFLT